jgi:hypothetical protein
MTEKILVDKTTIKYQLVDYDLLEYFEEEDIKYWYARFFLLGDDGEKYHTDTKLFDPLWERGSANFLLGTSRVVRILRELGTFDESQINDAIASSYAWRWD